MKSSLPVFLLVVLFTSCEQVQNSTEPSPTDQNIQKYFRTLQDNHDFSGVILIGDYQDINHMYSFGFADYVEKKKHTANSRFGIASLTKTFTAAAILKLRDQKKLSLNDSVNKFIPDFPNGEKITVLNLLRHESGLDNIDYGALKSKRLESDELISEIGKKDLLFEPGKNGAYSNAGFSVLARIVEVVSEVSFESFLGNQFFDPLGMENSGDRIHLTEDDLFSRPYFPGPPPELLQKVTEVNPSLSFGSGSLYSTVIDLWKWGQAIGQQQMVDVFAENYPYGWGRDSIAGHFSLNQTGMQEGFVSAIHVFPDRQKIIVLLSNIENGLWSDWAKDLARIYFEQESSAHFPEKRELRKNGLSPSEIENIVGTFQKTPSRFVEIKNIDNHLYLYLNGDYRGHYLSPLDKQTFDLRSFTGKIGFSENQDTLIWTLPKAWGGSTENYIRE